MKVGGEGGVKMVENKRGGERKLGLGGEGIFMNVGVGSGEV